jgi:hypothetical protein
MLPVADIPLALRARIWTLRHGAPTHFSRAVRNVLNNSYHDQWIGGGGPTAWPPRRPDLNPTNFNLWGHLKTLVYAATLDNEETLHLRILYASQTILNCPSIFERMGLSMMTRVVACTESHGGHFEHLL